MKSNAQVRLNKLPKPQISYPTIPGEMLIEEYLKPLSMTQSALAAEIGVSYRTINEICNGRRAITPKLALLFAAYFKTSPEYWLNMQMAIDLWKEWEKTHKRKKAS